MEPIDIYLLIILLPTTASIWYLGMPLVDGEINLPPSTALLEGLPLLMLALLIEMLFFRIVQTLRERKLQLEANPIQMGGGRLTKDLCDVVMLSVGLVIQQHMKEISLGGMSEESVALWLLCLLLVLTIVLILRRNTDYGFIDVFIGLFLQALVYFHTKEKTKHCLVVSVLCMVLVILRNRFDEFSRHLFTPLGQKQIRPPQRAAQPPRGQANDDNACGRGQ